MKNKKIFAVLMCVALLVGFVPVIKADASGSSDGSLVIPDWVTDSGYSYDNSTLLYNMPAGGRGQDQINFISYLGFTPCDMSLEELETSFAYLEAKKVTDRLEVDFFDYYDVYYSAHLRSTNGYLGRFSSSSTRASETLSYIFYFVPKTVRLALFDNDAAERYFVYCPSESSSDIYVLFYNVTVTENYEDHIYQFSDRNVNSSAGASFKYSYGSRAEIKYYSSTPAFGGCNDFIATNIPMFSSDDGAKRYVDDGTGNPVNPSVKFNKLSCDDFYFDRYDMDITQNSAAGYQLVSSFDYSCPDMVEHSEDYFIRIEATQVCTYEFRGRANKNSASLVVDTHYLSDGRGFSDSIICHVQSGDAFYNLHIIFDGIADAISTVTGGGDIDLAEINLISLNLYVTVTLYHSYVTFDSSGSSLVTGTKQLFTQTSSDIRTFSYDCLTGRTFDSHSPTIETKDVTDAEGNVVDRVVDSFSWYDNNYDVVVDRSYNEHTEYTDNSSGHNSTYTDNSTNKTYDVGDGSIVTDGNNNQFDWNWNWGTGSGGGSSGGGGSGGKFNLLDMLQWFKGLIEMLLNGDMDGFTASLGDTSATGLSGIMAVMHTFFSWLPMPIIIILVVGVLLYVICGVVKMFFS